MSVVPAEACRRRNPGRGRRGAVARRRRPRPAGAAGAAVARAGRRLPGAAVPGPGGADPAAVRGDLPVRRDHDPDARGRGRRDGEARAVVAGSSVLVVAFVALNLLAQYFGQLRASGGLDHYATLPVPPAAVVLGAAAAYASFTVPGTAVTAVGRVRAVPAADGASVGAGRGDPAGRRRARGPRARRSGCSRRGQELATLLRAAGHVGGAAAGRAARRSGCPRRCRTRAMCCPRRTVWRRWRGPSAADPDWAGGLRGPRGVRGRGGGLAGRRDLGISRAAVR